MTSAHKRIQDMGTKFNNLGKSAIGLGRSLTMGVTAPIVGMGALSVNTAAKFETSMAQVKVATGASGTEMTSLGKLAKKMGADTIFSAGESADAMLELAKAGMKPAEIRAGALKSTLDLAAASGMGLAESAVVMGAGMNTFGLKSKDSVQIVDALAGAANASSANVDDLALALQQVGAQASTSGFSIQETAAGLAALADAGIRGSDAGTSLKVFLQRLIPASGEAAEAMKNLGLEFFDSSGKMKPLKEIAGQLKKGFSGLTQEQRLAEMQTIFGSDAIRAATVLYDQGEDGLAKYITATSKSGAAAKMAGARMGGTAGAIEKLKGSLETAALIIGERLAPSIRNIAGDITSLINKFTALPVSTQETIVKIAALATVAGPVLLVFGYIMKAIGTAITIFKGLGAVLTIAKAGIGLIGTVLGAITVPVAIAIAAIAALIAVGYLVYRNWDTIKTFLGNVWEAIKSVAVTVWTAIADFFTKTIPATVSNVISWFAQLPGRIPGLLMSLAGSILYWIGYAAGWLIRKTIESITSAINWWAKLPGRIADFLTTIGPIVADLAARAGAWLVRKTVESINNAVSFWAALPGRIVAFAGSVASAAASLARGAYDAVKDWVSKIPAIVTSFISDLPGILIRAFGSVYDAAKRLAGKLWSGFKDGLGIHSPSFIEVALSNIMVKSAEALQSLKGDIGGMAGLSFRMPVAAPAFAVAAPAKATSAAGFAKGALITRPTLAWFAEKEPEVALPLSKAPEVLAETLRRAGNSSSSTKSQIINIYPQDTTLDERQMENIMRRMALLYG